MEYPFPVRAVSNKVIHHPSRPLPLTLPAGRVSDGVTHHLSQPLRWFWISAVGFPLLLIPTSIMAAPMIERPAMGASSLSKDDRPAQVEIKLPPLEDQQPSITVDVEQELPPQLDLDDFDFWAEQCQQLVAAQQYEDGLDACNQAIAIDDKGDHTHPVWAARAEALIYQGEYVDALISLDQVLTEETTDSLLITQQCVAYVHNAQYEDAVDSCESALLIDGNWGTRSPAFAWYYRGIALQEQGFLETSLWSFERAARVGGAGEATGAGETTGARAITEAGQDVGWVEDTKPNTPLDERETEDELGVTLSDMSALIEELGLTATSPEPLGQAEWCHTLHLLGEHRGTFAGQSPLDECDLDDTIAYYEQAANLYPQDIILRLRQGLALEQLGDYSRALAAYEQGLGVASDHPKLLARKCSMLNQLDRYEEALAACELALEAPQPQSVGDTAHALNQYSVALIGLERYDEALTAAERAIATHPTYGPAYTSNAVSLWHLGRNPEALDLAQTTLKIYAHQEAVFDHTFYRPNADPWPLFYRDYGVAYFNQGRILAAVDQRPSILSTLGPPDELQSTIRSIQMAYENSLRQPIYHLERQWPERLDATGQSRLAGEDHTLLEMTEALSKVVPLRQTLAVLTPDRFVDTILNLSATFLNPAPTSDLDSPPDSSPHHSLAFAQMATTIDPDSFIGWYNMGLAAQAIADRQARQNAYDKVIERYSAISAYAFSVAQQLDPEHPHLQLAMADVAALHEGGQEEAIARYTQILTGDPSREDVKEKLMAMANEWVKLASQEGEDAQARRQEAIALYTHILVLDPTYQDAKQEMVGIGDTLLATGNIGEAIATYDHVLNLDPHYRPAQNARAAALQPTSSTEVK